MESSHPYPIGPGARVLAAIVFTDVVSFSARIQAEEDSTLGLMEQDFAAMKKQCEHYGGSVLKSTGDGLLLYFSSAVHAVKCAVKIQKTFAERAKTNPEDKALVHRIGIHLGDVFAKDQDVMGDGVNIAARLQAAADPGGICISQTVYDVVKNKLKLPVERLMPRELKNISDVGHLYRVLLEPRKARPAPMEYRMAKPEPKALFSRTELLVALGLLVLGGAWVVRWALDDHYSQVSFLDGSQAKREKLGELLREGAVVDKVGGVLAGPGGGVPGKSGEPGFAELTLGNPAGDNSRTDAQNAALRARATEATQVLLSWISSEIKSYSREAPLPLVRSGNPLQGDLIVFAAPDNEIAFGKPGAFRPRKWEELDIADQEALILSALRRSRSAPPPEVLVGAEAFAYLHGLKRMAEELRSRTN